MKKQICIISSILIILSSCSEGSSNSAENNPPVEHIPSSSSIEQIVFETEDIPCDNYRQAMRDFVIKISETARKTNPSFIVIPQNGQCVAWDDDDNPKPDKKFFAAINGCGREDTFYGMNSTYDIADGTATPKNLSDEIQELCDIYVNNGLTVLSTDYTTDDKTKINDSFSKNNKKSYISFAATDRLLRVIPSYAIYNENDSDITKLSDAKNFLYLIDPDNFTKQSLIDAIKETNYDVLILELFMGSSSLSSEDLKQLKTKNNGGKRLVICYMSIGEAEDYRGYWRSSWKKNPPLFMCDLNTDWEGNYEVKYWFPSWQSIICEASDSYLSKIVNAGFDGVYLDIIDAFEYFEEKS